jgi:pyrroline-5-carboxylate reductase
MKIGVLGVGVMGEIIVSSLLSKEIVGREDLVAFDIHQERLKNLQQKFGFVAAKSAIELGNNADLIILATKPQNAVEVFQALHGRLLASQLVISIMAGIKLSQLQKGLCHKRLIRCMPNLAAKISQGMTVWMAGPETQDADRMLAKMIFQSFGRELEVDSEEKIDAATAVSGSGPAYIYYMAESLMETAVDLKFSEPEALKLVHQTFLGAMELWAETRESPALLRQKVTSKKGTTDAAMKEFEKNTLKQKFKDGVQAAYLRSIELGKEKVTT